MIAGPILPRTADGLWEAVRSDPERLERGLRLVRRELVLEAGFGGAGAPGGGAPGDGVVVDALAADAIGAPVLLFVALIDRDRELPSRIAEAREWFARNASMLAPILDGSGVRVDLPARVFVVGFEFSDACLERLRRDARRDDDRVGDLAAFRVEALYVDGVRHVGVVRVLGGSGDPELGAPTDAPIAQRARQLAGLLDRIDPGLAVDGDRYSRAWRLDGTTVIRLERDARRLFAVVPDVGMVEIVRDEDAVEACDLAMRRYLAIHDGEVRDAGAADSVPSSAGAGTAGAGASGSSFAAARRSPPEPSPRHAGGQGHGVQGHGVKGRDAEVSPDEFEAFLADDVRRRS